MIHETFAVFITPESLVRLRARDLPRDQPPNRLFKIVFKFMRRPALLPTASSCLPPETGARCCLLTRGPTDSFVRLMDIGSCVWTPRGWMI